MTGLHAVAEAVVTKLEAPYDLVLSELLQRGFPEHLSAVAPRHLSLRRLRVRGTKTVNGTESDFDRAFQFSTGVTVIHGDNLRGKSTILEIVALMLRGEPRGLQADVLGWLQQISLDISVNGEPLGLRLNLDGGIIGNGAIIPGTVETLAALEDEPHGDSPATVRTSGPDEWAAAVSQLMLDRLGLEPVHQFAKNPDATRPGTLQLHGWPAYFSAVFPPVGANDTLLGDTTGTALNQDLLNVFLDFPGAALRTRLRSASRMMDAQQKAAQAQDQATAKALATQLETARTDLVTAEAALAALNAAADGADPAAAELARDDAAGQLVLARRRRRALNSQLEEAREAQFESRRQLADLIESHTAGRLFHGLDVRACPRCEADITPERQANEKREHSCSVCSQPVVEHDDTEHGQARASLESIVDADQKAIADISGAADSAHQAEQRAKAALDAAEEILAETLAAPGALALTGAQQAVAVSQGIVAALASLEPPASPVDETAAILAAAAAELTSLRDETSKSVLSDVNEQVATLARRFGMTNLERVDVKLNLNMPVWKGGGSTSPFGQQSAGEKLRLRYALVLALLIVGRAREAAGHPGLLLLDSPRAEEVQDQDVEAILTALVELHETEPSLQVLVTTQDATLEQRVNGLNESIAPVADGGLF